MDPAQELVVLQKTLYTSKNPTRRWLHCLRRDWIISKIIEYSKGRAIISLETGPGSGVYIPTLSDVSYEVVASDIENAHLNNIEGLFKTYPNVRLVVDDISATRLRPSSFNLILCSEVIEHINGSAEVLGNFFKLLKPDGILILSTPQKFSTLEVLCKIAFLPGIIQLVRLIYGESILKTGHINLKTQKQLMKEIRQAGFTIVEQYKCGFYLPLIAEFLGEAGLSLEKGLEKTIRKTKFMDWLLWTQAYVLKK
ncbi:MAG TPA: class I SAM-dependent methyltransferase [Candidatus Omnitrophota bacterium]|nr:class I SAM-dependent methyltransferase [Candidatus Omnitrophota bacterium]